MTVHARWLWLVLACGCQATSSQVVVLIDAQPAAREVASELHLRVLSTDGTVRLDDTRSVDGDTGWPLRLPLVPEGGDASRGWIVEATLTDAADAVLSVARLRGRYVAGVERETSMCMYDGCASEPCGAAATDCTGTGASCMSCRAGSCVEAVAVLEAPGSSPRCPTPGCTALGPRETLCSDGGDDDCDGRIDCRDPDCGCDTGTCVTMGEENVYAVCRDGIDQDCDGLTDCADPDCHIPENTMAVCRDGIDQDCDGAADCSDLDCIFPEAPENCGNGLDDDCDTRVDCLDDGCCAAPSCNQRACGPGSLRCCDGACVNIYTDRNHCGGCGVVCAPGRACDRPTSREGGVLDAAGCRCMVGAGECYGGLGCEEHGGSLCNCENSDECPGESECVRQGTNFHAACFIPRR